MEVVGFSPSIAAAGVKQESPGCKSAHRCWRHMLHLTAQRFQHRIINGGGITQVKQQIPQSLSIDGFTSSSQKLTFAFCQNCELFFYFWNFQFSILYFLVRIKFMQFTQCTSFIRMYICCIIFKRKGHENWGNVETKLWLNNPYWKPCTHLSVRHGEERWLGENSKLQVSPLKLTEGLQC